MDIPDWIYQDRPPARPTELFAPVQTAIYPVTVYAEPAGDFWEAALVIEGFGERTCDHRHVEQDEAWDCAEGMALSLAVELSGQR